MGEGGGESRAPLLPPRACPCPTGADLGTSVSRVLIHWGRKSHKTRVQLMLEVDGGVRGGPHSGLDLGQPPGAWNVDSPEHRGPYPHLKPSPMSAPGILSQSASHWPHTPPQPEPGAPGSDSQGVLVGPSLCGPGASTGEGSDLGGFRSPPHIGHHPHSPLYLCPLLCPMPAPSAPCQFEIPCVHSSSGPQGDPRDDSL